MGQYYNAVVIDKNGKPTGINRTLANGEYTPAKLTEHSWWYNPYVGALAKMLYHHPMQIAWVGDYADNVGVDEDVFAAAHRYQEKEVKVDGAEFPLDGKFLVNHSEQLYLNCDVYRATSTKANEDPEWVLHPLPLLTAIGNGQGGGDYFGTDEEKVGVWYMDELSVEDEVPEGYQEFFCTFREKINKIRYI